MSVTNRLRSWRRAVKRLRAAAPLILGDERAKYPEVVVRFEEAFASYIGCRYGLTFCNGTSSIEAALFAVGVRPGDKVLVPAFTFHASVSPVLNAGAMPVFVDADPATTNVDLADFDRKAASGARAAVVTHLWGRPVDMDALMAIASERGIAVVEDCSHAHGAAWKGRRVGSFGEAGCFSLQAAKAVSAGEGGVAVTSNQRVWERMQLFGHFDRSQKTTTNAADARFGRAGVGHKLRAHPLAIAMAAVDLEALDDTNAHKRRLAGALRDRLRGVPGVEVLYAEGDSLSGGFFEGLPIRLNRGPVAALAAELATRGVGISTSNYQAWHLDPFMRDLSYRQAVLYEAVSGVAMPPPSLADDCPVATALLDSLILVGLDDANLGRLDTLVATLTEWTGKQHGR